MFHDPYCKTAKWKGNEVASVELSQEEIKSCDAVVITTLHTKNVDYNLVIENAAIVFDTKNAIESVNKLKIVNKKNIYRL